MDSNNYEIAVFGGGCFWCTEAVFQRVRGVVEVIPGYAGGQTPEPTYEQVAAGTTGHAEVVKVVFDPETVSYQDLLTVFFSAHDPTTSDRQGNDIGTQYRSIILTTSKQQDNQARSHLQPSFTTEVMALNDFYPAETYHHDYYNRNRNNTYCRLVIDPKVKKLFGSTIS